MATLSATPSNIDTDSFATYSDALQAAALTTTRLAASLPADLSFHRSIDPALARDVDEFSDRVLALTNKLVQVASGNASKLREEDDVLDEFVYNIVDPMEGVLENTDGALDVFLGKRKHPMINVPAVPIDPRQKKPKKQPFCGRLDPAITHAAHIPKPQLLFKHALSNTDKSPYIPAMLVPHKWCAKVPLGYVFYDEISERDMEQVQEDDEEERRKRTSHPYYYELTHPSYPDHVFTPPAKPSQPSSLDISSSESPSAFHPLTFVSTPKAFLSMANIISSETELAVDLEHHSYRSYKGFLALMQISTRRADFVVDLLVPQIREGFRQAKGKSVAESEEARMAAEAGQIIARVFADPSIIKVFHGAESDIVWLQQDFNIFVVGLFDTYHASKLLEFPKHSLAYLLETYCDFIPDKRYQLADWRIRPLPTEMLTYARSDTHFLLYIYDMLRLSLIGRPFTDQAIFNETGPTTQQAHHAPGPIYIVLTRSARTALRLYETEIYDTECGAGSSGWDTLARKWNKVGLIGSPVLQVPGPQAAVYKAVHRWREDIAREEDESARYVLQTHHLFLLAERMPTTISDLLSLFGGRGGVNGGVPPVLKRRAGELVAVIKDALEAAKSTLGPERSIESVREGSEVVNSAPIPIESEAMTFPGFLSSAARPAHESRLWTLAPSSTSTTMISISRSSLFGVGIPRECGQDAEKAYLTGESKLFGSALTESVAASSPPMASSTFAYTEVSGESAERFKDLMEKIHKTLVIAPVISIPPVIISVETQGSETSVSNVPMNTGDENNVAMSEAPGVDPGLAGQIEIPFVPHHKRQTLSNPHQYEPKDDTIVVVGRAGAKQRKRKRDKASASQLKFGIQSDGAGTSTHIGDHDQEVEEFDYSSVPNLLDDEGKNGDTRGVHEENERRKKKPRHGKGSGPFEYGDFRAPPRDQREVRGGNKTHTFR